MKKQVRAFLRMAGYYSRFIPAFAEMTSLPWKGTSDPANVRWRRWEGEEGFLWGTTFIYSSFLVGTLWNNRQDSAQEGTRQCLGGWALSCPRRWTGSTVRCCTSAGSSWSGKRGRAQRWNNVSSSSGQLVSYATSSWSTPSPSVRSIACTHRSHWGIGPYRC